MDLPKGARERINEASDGQDWVFPTLPEDAVTGTCATRNGDGSSAVGSERSLLDVGGVTSTCASSSSWSLSKLDLIQVGVTTRRAA